MAATCQFMIRKKHSYAPLLCDLFFHEWQPADVLTLLRFRNRTANTIKRSYSPVNTISHTNIHMLL